MCANNEPARKTALLADFDGVSLYPSSMARIPGYLLGTPKVWHPGVDLDATDGYFVKIRINTVGRGSGSRLHGSRIRTVETVGRMI